MCSFNFYFYFCLTFHLYFELEFPIDALGGGKGRLCPTGRSERGVTVTIMVDREVRGRVSVINFFNSMKCKLFKNVWETLSSMLKVQKGAQAFGFYVLYHYYYVLNSLELFDPSLRNHIRL